jgi:hypothetical protein
MARIFALALALLTSSASAYVNCTADADCVDQINQWGPTTSCAVTENGYSQCISCNYDQYQSACPAWEASMRTAASNKCGVTCTSPLSCTSDDNCTLAPDTTCSLAQGLCLTCDKTMYQNECGGWSEDEWDSAFDTCALKCGDKCQSDDDCVDMPNDRSSCVVQDGSWSSCINCATFATDCGEWSADFQAAAGTVCGLTCETTHDDDDAKECADDYTQ